MNNLYRKKPVVIEAFQMTREHRMDNTDWPDWLHAAWNKDRLARGAVFPRNYPKSDGTDELLIVTFEGLHLVAFDDWIIKANDKLYTCKPDVFANTYESASVSTTSEDVEALRKDAERWGAVHALMFIGNVELKQDEDGGYSISVDPVENQVPATWNGNTPEEAIDAAMKEKGGAA